MVMGHLNLRSKIIPIFSILLKFLSLTLIFALCSNAQDTIIQGEVLKDGQTLVSARGGFELGFFSPPNSSLRYVGIWYFDISVQTVVWVANRNDPIRDKNGSLSMEKDGNLNVLDGKESTVWFSNSTNLANNYTGILQDDGNFVIRSSSCNSLAGPYGICWQTFDHPTDTYLPGMRAYFNEHKGEVKLFTSWRSDSDPSNGNFSMGVDPRAAPQIVIWEGSNRVWRSGFWNGLMFTGVPSMSVFYSSGFKLSNADPQGNLYFTYSPSNMSYISFRFRVTWDGFERSLYWISGGHEWRVLQSEPFTDCDVYNKCGAYGYCTAEGDPICKCFRGFKPTHEDQWENKNWSGGCVRKTALQCEEENKNVLIGDDGFLEVDAVKLPDFANLLSGVGDDQSCQKMCSENCSCRAYAYVTPNGCMTWGDQLIDIQRFSTGGDKLYIRVAASDLDSKRSLSGSKIAAIVLSVGLFLCIVLIFLWKFRAIGNCKEDHNQGLMVQLKKSQGHSTDISGGSVEVSGDQNLMEAQDLPMFNYNIIASATNLFSEENKLGEGGFGPVYKGMLAGGQEIAVKKLSRKSGQGMEEFKNEIMLIAKLQHRNLVRILGFCMVDEEKMLVYEYMPQKSLDGFIFDPVKQGQLDWRRRVKIIEGVARGILYLHRDARCRIIHRDLKASNILLDQDMNPKISDFGMARIFGTDQNHMNTNRVVGTYGYMSPEYAMEGLFSEKSDVYSFGVLLLEIVTGRRNTSYRSSEHITLVEYAWQVWKEGKAVELIDPSIRNSSTNEEVSRIVHIALLCVHDSTVYRPIMSQVVLWLESDSVTLTMPKEPTLVYSSWKGSIDIDSLNREVHNVEPLGNLTISTVVPR